MCESIETNTTLAEKTNRTSTDSFQAESLSFCEDSRLCQVSALLRCCNSNFQGTLLAYLDTHCWTHKTWDASWVFLFVSNFIVLFCQPEYKTFLGRWEGLLVQLEVIAHVLVNTSFCNPSTQ